MEIFSDSSAEYAQHLVEQSLDNIYANGWETARRIRDKIPEGMLLLGPVYLRNYFPPRSYTTIDEGFPFPHELAEAETIGVTDSPERVFGHQNFLTIASSLCLDVMQDKESFRGIEETVEGGVLLSPTMDHYDHDVYTHKGVGLSLLSGVMRTVGIDLGNLDRFVWLGQQVDPEQWVLEDTIARRGKEIDRELSPLFYEGSVFRHTLNPYLKKVLSGLMEGKLHYNDDPGCREYVDTFLDVIHRNRGVRGSWFMELEGVLKGEIPPSFSPSLTPETLEARLFTSWRNNRDVPKESQVMLFEIDAERYYETTPVHPLHIGTRHPQSIVPAPRVLASTISTIYVKDLNNVPNGVGLLNAQVKHISELPESKWLTDSNGRPVTPEQVSHAGIDPRRPVCTTRYIEDPVMVWQRYFRQGIVAPMFMDVQLNSLISQDGMLGV